MSTTTAPKILGSILLERFKDEYDNLDRCSEATELEKQDEHIKLILRKMMWLEREKTYREHEDDNEKVFSRDHGWREELSRRIQD